MKIAYLGIPGSYSEMTAQDYIQKNTQQINVQLLGFDQFDEMIQSLVDKKIDTCVLPVENSTTGLISAAIDSLLNQPVFVVEDAYQTVSHTLWSIEGANLDQIKEVYSHPQALAQCDQFFNSYPNIQALEYTSTAQAAQMVYNLQDPTKAALASERAGQLIGLTPLLKNVQTENDNATHFYILKHQDYVTAQGSRLVLYIEPRKESGALSRILQTFDIHNCELQRLVSHPLPNRPFGYGFIIEVDIDAKIDRLDFLYDLLQEVSQEFRVMGQFNPSSYRFQT